MSPMQEVELACMFGKPLVVVVLTQEAWELLTVRPYYRRS